MVSSASASNKKLTLISSDEQAFEVEEKVITVASETLKNLVEDGCCSTTTTTNNNDNNNEAATADIPLFNVHGSTLSKVIQYCNYHHHDQEQQQHQDQEDEDDIDHNNKDQEEEKEGYCNNNDNMMMSKKKWDEEFVGSVDMDGLYDMIMAANFLAIKGLLDLTTQRVADLIKGKSVAEIRRLFNIENDFSPEEEADLRKQYPWAFEE